MKKLIYDLPIYSMPKEKFMKSWTNRINDFNHNEIKNGRSEKEIKKAILDKYYPQYLFEYNQIIGYVSIYVDDYHLVYKLHLVHGIRNIRAISKVRHFIKEKRIRNNKSGISFKTNLQIKEQIENDLAKISRKYFTENYYIDKTLFYNTIDYLDIISLIDFG